jgi:tRNA(adenine34) deaminase
MAMATGYNLVPRPCGRKLFPKVRAVTGVKDDIYWMGRALRQATLAEKRGEVPIGAVVVREGVVIGSGYNLRETAHDPTAHAELIAIRKASRRSGAWRLTGCTVYVTLEPCLMCMGAMILARIDRLVYGCRDPKGGAAGTLYDVSDDPRLNHRFPVDAGVREEECSRMLTAFFSDLRSRKKAELLDQCESACST